MTDWKFRVAAAALVAGLYVSPAFAQGSVAGDWELTIAAPQGANTVNLSLKQDGDKVTGDLSSQLGSVPIAGTVAAGAATLSAKIEIQGMSLDMGFTGKVEGDTFNGNVKFGEFGEFPFTGKRASANTAAAAAPAAAAPAPAATTGSLNAGGKWDVVLSITGLGEVPVNAVLKQEGNTVTGTLISMAGEVPVAGTVTGNTLKLDFKAETPQGAIQVTMTGEGTPEGMKGKASLAGIGEADWTATRSAQQ